MTDRITKKRRLERAGYVALSGWVPKAYADRVLAQVEMHRDDIAKITGAPAKPRGRPRVEPQA